MEIIEPPEAFAEPPDPFAEPPAFAEPPVFAEPPPVELLAPPDPFWLAAPPVPAPTPASAPGAEPLPELLHAHAHATTNAAPSLRVTPECFRPTLPECSFIRHRAQSEQPRTLFLELIGFLKGLSVRHCGRRAHFRVNPVRPGAP